jgi:hypothetical protein
MQTIELSLGNRLEAIPVELRLMQPGGPSGMALPVVGMQGRTNFGGGHAQVLDDLALRGCGEEKEATEW